MAKDRTKKDGHPTICLACVEARLKARAKNRDAEAEAWSRYPSGYKRCSHCGKDRRLDEFTLVQRSYDGLKHCCMHCVARNQNKGKRRRRPAEDGPAYVYRLLTSDRSLIYVGYTVNVYGRLFRWEECHAETKDWWPHVAIVDILTFATISDARAMEAELITRERPPKNRARPRRKDRPLPTAVGSRTFAIDELTPDATPFTWAAA